MPVTKCAVTGCRSTKSTVHLYKLPRNATLRKLWLKNLKPFSPALAYFPIKSLVEKKICRLHFEDQYITNRKRSPLCCPTLFTTEEILSGRPTNPVIISSLEYVKDEHTYAVSSGVCTSSKRTYSDGDIASQLLNVNREHTYSLNSRKRTNILFSGADGISPTKISNESEPENEEAGADRPVGDVVQPVGYQTLHNDETSEIMEEQFYDDDILQSNNEQPSKPTFSWQKDSAAVACETLTDEIDVLMQCDETDELYMYPEGGTCSAGSQDRKDAVPVVGVSKQDYKCNLCGGSINGIRYTCVQCVDFDLCATCEARGAHALHYVLRVPAHRTHNEMFAVLQTLRRILVTDSVIQMDSAAVDELKVEVKEEVVDPIYVEQMTSPAAGGTSSKRGENVETVYDPLEEDVETVYNPLEEDVETVYDPLEEDVETVYNPLEEDVETVYNPLEEDVETVYNPLEEDVETVYNPLEEDVETVYNPLEEDVETGVADPLEVDVEMLEEYLDSEPESSHSKAHGTRTSYVKIAPKPTEPLYLVVGLDNQRQMDVRLSNEMTSRELRDVLGPMTANVVSGLSSTSQSKSNTVGHRNFNTNKTNTQTRFKNQTTHTRPSYGLTSPRLSSLSTEALHRKVSPVQVYSYNVQNTDVSQAGTSRDLDLDSSLGKSSRPAQTLATLKDGVISAVKVTCAGDIPNILHKNTDVRQENAPAMVPRVVLEDVCATRKS